MFLLFSPQTQGLLGTMDQDVSNEFETPLGDVIPADSNDDTVYFDFSLKCRLFLLLLFCFCYCLFTCLFCLFLSLFVCLFLFFFLSFFLSLFFFFLFSKASQSRMPN